MADFSQELKKDFLEEAFDLLDSLEKSLLVLEKNPADDKAIQSVFRAAHTIKGGAGTVGFPEIQELMHIVEDVLDLTRKKQLSLQSGDITLLLQCEDELAKMLNSRENDQVYSHPIHEELKKKLLAIKQSVGKMEKKTSVPVAVVESQPDTQTQFQQIMTQVPLSREEFSLIYELLSKKRMVYILRYRFNDDYEMKDVSGFQVYALLNDISEIIKIHPGLSELEKAYYPEVTFIVASDKDETFIRDKTNLRDLNRWMLVVKLNIDMLHELEQAQGIDVKNTTPPPTEASKQTPVHPKLTSVKELDASESLQKRNVSTLRVESWKIDELLNLLGELVITKASFGQLSHDLDRSSSDIKSTMKDFISGVDKLSVNSDGKSGADKNKMLLDALNLLFHSVDDYSELLQKFNRISSSLQENVMNMRMVPIQMVFSRFPRLIRDIAEKLGKKIELLIEGVETEIDKGMVDDIFDPLIHILRNSVDHGIETPQERTAAGKPEVGRIILKAVHKGDSIVIEVTDDGKGIDVGRLRQKAIENGFLTKEAAEKLNQRKLLALVFLPGLSTAKEVTDLSGRGVGMDVVKRKIEEIGGSVGLATVKGKGTKIVIRLPLTLAIIQGLIIIVNNMHYIIPIASVEETVTVKMKDLQEINGRLTLELRGKFVPIMALSSYFYGDSLNLDSEREEFCIISKYGESLIGIIVNEVIGEQDIVIKSLNTKLIKSPGISAATIIGNGEIGYIIDTAQIISQYFQGKSAE